MYILGMAKSYPDLKGARYRGMKLDYLTLLFALRHLDNTKATGYMLVLTDVIRQTIIQNWNRQFELNDGDGLTILSLEECDPNTYQRIMELKSNEDHSGAADCMEKWLKQTLKERHPNAAKVTKSKPLKVDWDYCAVIQ
jgi:hypothetical protein